MELRQLEALRTIVETGSFTAAARQLGVTQSALSHQIKNLERELHETLLVRASPRVYPSPAGAEVLLAAERILAEVGQLKQQFAPSASDQMVGTLRVAASTLGIVYLYGHLYELFLLTYPSVELILTAAETPADGLRQVIARTADVAFAPFPLEFSDPDLQTVTLGRVEHVIIVAPQHALAGAVTVSVDELRRVPFIRYVLGAGTRRAADHLFLAGGGYPPILMESNDTEFIKRTVRMGLGVAMVPHVTVLREIESGDLLALRVVDTVIVQDFGLVYRGSLRVRALEAFKALCVEKRDTIPGVVGSVPENYRPLAHALLDRRARAARAADHSTEPAPRRVARRRSRG